MEEVTGAGPVGMFSGQGTAPVRGPGTAGEQAAVAGQPSKRMVVAESGSACWAAALPPRNAAKLRNAASGRANESPVDLLCMVPSSIMLQCNMKYSQPTGFRIPPPA